MHMNVDVNCLPVMIIEEKTGRWLWSLQHLCYEHRPLNWLQRHHCCSASQCSLASFSPRWTVWAIFSLPVQRGSTTAVATWIWGLCHSCRLEQQWSCKPYSFLFPQLFPQLEKRKKKTPTMKRMRKHTKKRERRQTDNSGVCFRV